MEDLLFERGIDICHETVWFWWNRFGPMFAGDVRCQRVSRMRGFRHWRWHLDERYVKLNGEMVYLWRAADQQGEILESHITRTRDSTSTTTSTWSATSLIARPNRSAKLGRRSPCSATTLVITITWATGVHGISLRSRHLTIECFRFSALASAADGLLARHRLSRIFALTAVTLVTHATPSAAQVATAKRITCPTRAYRWEEDCSVLHDTVRSGVDRLRYVALDQKGKRWLSIGGEARTRVDMLDKVDFGINGAPGFVELSGRLLAHADLRSAGGARAFVQLGVVQQTGRKPNVRAQDESPPDLTQAFIDLPVQLGAVRLVGRAGRQELSLSGNRLVTSRDGTTLRRAFQGLKADIAGRTWRLALVRVRPIDLRQGLFADRADRSEQFTAASLDLPTFGGTETLNLFVFHRQRDQTRYLRSQGQEQRYTFGAHYDGRFGNWSIDAQGAWQSGRATGKAIRAFGGAVSIDRELDTRSRTAVELNGAVASGDKAGSAAIETFDPTYPNNMGLSDAPLLYQTNYIAGGGNVSTRLNGVIWTASATLLARQSVGDAVYANGAPIKAPFGANSLTSLFSQVSARLAVNEGCELYAVATRAQAIGSIAAAGGKTALYGRVQLTTRF